MHSEKQICTWRWTWIAVGLAGFVFAVGCSESRDSDCAGDQDCASGEECVDGVCQVTDTNRCNRNSQCPPDFVCRNFQCEPEADSGAPTDTGEDDDQEDVGGDTTAQDASAEDVRSDTPDEQGPQVVRFEPSRDATGVDPTTDITINFSEPIREGSVHADSVSLIGPNGQQIDLFAPDPKGSVSHPEPDKLVIETDAPLKPASPYRVVLAEFLQDNQRNPLQDAPVEGTFSTDWDEPMEHLVAARKWAPRIYQGIADASGTGPHNDLPTAVNFDGDFDASNNEDNARRDSGPTPKAKVYYQVTESISHLFVTYIAYYPTFKFEPNEDNEHREHHFAGVMLLVDKETDSLVVADGLSLRNSDAEWTAFAEADSGVSEVGSNTQLIDVSKSNWQLEDDTHYPMYVKASNHETCHWYSEGDASGVGTCLHGSESFIADQGAVLKPGADAQSWGDRNTDGDHPTLTYKLVPLAEHFWAKRNQTGSSRLFSERFTYEPNSSDSGRWSGFPDNSASHRVPKALNSDDSDSVGETPFRWRSFANDEGDGQWTLDPAFVASDRFSLSGSQNEISKDYCFNLYFNLDDRNNENCLGGTSGGDAGTQPDSGSTTDTGTLDAGN